MLKRNIEDLASIANEVRKKTVTLVYRTRSPHIASALSIIDILVALYFRFLNVDPSETNNPNRDKFVLSKGHACTALYAILAERGFISNEDLEGFAKQDGILELHPNRDEVRGIEISTGSLGHGLSVACGFAIAAKIQGRTYRTVALLSDGELNEGSTWEAVMFAAHHRLHNLIAMVDANGMQALGFTKDILDLTPIDEKWKSFGWCVKNVDGHDIEDLLNALNNLSMDKPNVIICNTIKGKGISFMENNILWHYRAPDDEEYEKAMKELG